MSAGASRCARRLLPLAVTLVVAACTGQGDLGTTAEGIQTPSEVSGGDPEGSPPAGEVRIERGEEMQAVVDAHPPGTTFVIAAGVHRGAVVRARDGDRYIGEPGAVMTGARPLEDFEREGAHWVHHGLDIEPLFTGDMDEGFAREGLRHDLYVDGDLMRHVETRADVGQGRWFYDFAIDQIVLGEDPTGREVELSVDHHAFSGPGTADVHISDLTIRRYASPAQFGAINGLDTVDWTVERVEVTGNHGSAIRFGHGMHIRDSLLAGNGQIGINGSQDHLSERPLEITGNEIRDNGVLGFTWFWEKGGIKVVGTTGTVIRDNVVESNQGPGIWFDIQNDEATIADNVVVDNSIMGIFWELSDGVVIEGNTITGNGWDANPRLAAGVSVSNAGRVTMRGNTLAGNTNEFVVVQADRENMGTPPLDMLMEDNDITIAGGFVGVSILTGEEELYDPAVMQFRSNRYTLDGCEPCFFWDDRVTTEQWLELGLDVDSEFVVVAS